VNLTECLLFSSQRGKNDLIRIAVLSTGAATNEALFFFKGEHNEALRRHDPSQITHQDFNLFLSKNLKGTSKHRRKDRLCIFPQEDIDSMGAK